MLRQDVRRCKQCIQSFERLNLRQSSYSTSASVLTPTMPWYCANGVCSAAGAYRCFEVHSLQCKHELRIIGYTLY
jgi:hypothetical protein